MRKNSLKMKVLFLILVSISGCAEFPVKEMTPSFLDPAKSYARVWHVKASQAPKCGDPNYEFFDSGERKPISEMAGYVCLPTDQAQKIVRFYNEWQRREANCPNFMNEELFIKASYDYSE